MVKSLGLLPGAICPSNSTPLSNDGRNTEKPAEALELFTAWPNLGTGISFKLDCESMNVIDLMSACDQSHLYMLRAVKGIRVLKALR